MSDRPDISAGPPLSVTEAVAQVAAEQARELRRQGRKIRRHGDPDAVHDMRVATRRLRTALRVMKSQVGTPASLRRGLQRLARRLGRVRDHDVMLDLLGAVRLEGATKDERERLTRLVERLQRRRMKARKQLARFLDRPGQRELVDRVDAIAARPEPRGHDAPAARVLADAVASLGAAAEGSPGMNVAEPSPTALHRLRIGFKQLRYALDFHSGLGLGYDVERRLAREMQDVLGELHDRDLLLGWLAGAEKPFAGDWPVLTARLLAERARLMRRFRRLRGEWSQRTRPQPEAAVTEMPRFVNLEAQPVTLRLVTGPRSVAVTMKR